MRTASKGKHEITRGSGNVFADLGFPDAEERQTKLRLAHALNAIIGARRLTQAAAAQRLGLTQPRMNDLLRGRIAKFSLDALIDVATRAGLKVRVDVRRAA